VPLKKDYPAAGLLAAVVLASLAPGILLGAFLFFQYVSNERATALERVNAIAGSISATLDREFQGRIETLQALAAKRYLHAGELGLFADVLRAASSVSPGDFVLTDEAGNQHINTRSELSGSPAKAPDHAELQRVFQTKSPQVSDLFRDAANGSYRFAIRIPIDPETGPRYAFGYVPRNDKVLGVLRESSLPQGWFAAILDRKGHIVARSSRNDEFAGKPASPDFVANLTKTHGQIESVDLEGRETITSYQRSPLSEWVTVVWVPKQLLQESLNTALAMTSALALAALLLSLAAGYAVSRLIRKPTDQLLQSAQALKSGNIVVFDQTAMREANVIGEALADASRDVQLYMREISHRSKNLLAVVQSISRQTQRSSPDLKTFAQRFDSRLESLARSHDLLVNRNWGGVPIRELIEAQLESFVTPGDDRIGLEGPVMSLSPAASQHIGLAIHELATNATKYGALSGRDGRVSISWNENRDCDGRPIFRLIWAESGGPPVSAASKKGFGRFVIETAVARGVLGKSNIDWQPTGLVWTLEAPSPRLVDKTTFQLDEKGG
jgi:two-component sensor histidine kinase